MIKLTVTTQNEQAAVTSAKTLDARVLQGIQTGLARGLLLTVSIIQTEFIQDGPRVRGEFGPGARLTSLTGRLRQSITSKVQGTANQVVGAIGSSVKYAAFHEFGFHGVQNVRAHTRVIDQVNSKGAQVDTRRRITTAAGEFVGFKESRRESASFQKSGFATVQFVKAHSRVVNYAGKPYIRPALNKMQPTILDEIRKELAVIK